MAISQRYLAIDNGHMILTGNTLMIYQQDAVSGGPFTTTDASLQVPGYPAGTTLNWQENSSMAVLTIPPTATVLRAELTWSSLLIAGAIDYSAFANDPVNFTTPAGLTPVAVEFSELTNDIATRSADVTALVQAGGSGQYTLGRIAGVNGIESTGITGNAAGWYLSVVVHDPAESSKLFQINVGNIFVPALSQIDFSISGFSTPASGPVTGRLFAGIQRGDPVVDNISIFTGPDTSSLTYQLTRPPLPPDNMIAGFISNTETGALIDTSGTFGNNNNIPGNPPIPQAFARWHIDIAAFDISPSLTNNQTSLVTRSISNGPISVFDYNVYNVQIEAQSATLTTTKTASQSFAKPGDTITYTLVTTNSGTIQADNVVITDVLPVGTTFVPGSVTGATGTPPTLTIASPILPGGSATVTFQVTVDTIPTPNTIVNTADINYTFVPLPGTEPISGSETSTPATTQVNAAVVSIVKTSSPALTDVNGVITYTLTLQNTGNVPANNVVITDAIPAGTSFVAGSVTGATGTPPTLTLTSPIAVGGTSTVTFQVKVGNTLPVPNPITNTATAEFTYTVDPADPNGASGNATSNTTTTQVNSAIITTTKTVDKALAGTGDILTYTLVLQNSGNVVANNVVLTDVVPAGTTFVAGSVTGATGTPPTLNVAPIAAGNSATVTFQVKVGNTLPVPNPIPNSASATFTYTVDPENPDGAGGTSASNVATTQVNAAIVSTVKSVDKTFAKVGDVLTYTLVLTNSGNVPATNVVITDAVPTGTTFIAGSLFGATGTPPTLTLNAPIPVGGTSTVVFQVLVGDTIPTLNPISNSATAAFTYTVDPANPDGGSGTSASNAITTQINSAIVETVKTADLEFANVGDTITYTITVTNSGNVAANNVVLTDAIPTGTTFVAGSLVGATGTPPTLTLNSPVPAGGSVVVSYEVKVGAAVPNPNPVENSASAAFTYTVDPAKPNGESSTSYSNTVATQVNTAKLVMTKSVDKAVAYIGDTITYQISVKNTGNAPANNVVITDPVPVGTVLVPGSMIVSVPFTPLPGGAIQLTNPVQPGETVTISFKVLVTAIPNPNPIVNVANAAYTYTVDPAQPNGVSASTKSNAATTVVFRNNFSQQISDLIESVALEQAGLAAIANAEGAKIQRMVAMSDVSTQELLCLNKSVSNMMDSLAMLESILKQKLSVVDCQINGTSGC